RYGVTDPGRYAANVANETAITDVHAGDLGADTDHVVGRGDACSSLNAQSNVGVAGEVERERAKPDGRVGRASCVINKCTTADGGVETLSGVAKERPRTEGRVTPSGGIAEECTVTDGRVGDALGIAEQSGRPICRVATAGRVV